MANRRIFCEVVEGICLEDRCLYKLKKIIEGNRTCESCMVREIEDIKSARAKKEKEKIELYSRKDRKEKIKRSKRNKDHTGEESRVTNKPLQDEFEE